MAMRVGGLSSGMDTENIIKDLLKPEQAKVDRLSQQLKLVDYKMERYHTQNVSFANTILNVRKEFELTSVSSSGTLINNSVNSLDWVKKATSSTSTYAEVTARADAKTGTYQIKVNSLASRWESASSSSISTGATGSVATQFGLQDDDIIEFTITANEGTTDEKSVSINMTDLTEKTLASIVNSINNAKIGVTARYDTDLDRFFLEQDGIGADKTVTITETTRHADGTYFSFLTGAPNAPLATVDSGSANTMVLDFDQQLYNRSGATLSAISTGTDIKARFTYQSIDGGGVATAKTITSAVYSTDSDGITSSLSFALTDAAVAGDSIMIDYSLDGNKVYDANGNLHKPKMYVFNGATWAENTTPTASIDDGSSSTAMSQTFNKALYRFDGVDTYSALTDAEDISSFFTYTPATGSTGTLTSATWDATNKEIDFVFGGAPTVGDTITMKTTSSQRVYDVYGEEYEVITATFDGTEWIYGDQEASGLQLKRFTAGPGSSVVNITNDGTTQGGTDASIDYGVATNITRSSNEFAIDGLRFKLSSVGGPFTVTVTADADGILEKVQNFITEYNTMMTTALNTLSEERVKLDSRTLIMPLTEEQEAAMTAEQIEKWEANCKVGLLRSNTYVEEAISVVRLGMYQSVNFEPDPKYPQAYINGGSSSLGMTLTWNQPLYYLAGGTAEGDLTAFASGADLASRFDYVRASGSTGAITAASYTTSGDEDDTPTLEFTFSGTPVAGDAIVIKDGTAYNMYDADGDQYTARRMVYNGSAWVAESLNAFTSITDIGISTESYQQGSRGGQLTLNESTLRDAINEDVDAVINLLFKEPPSDYKYISEDQLTASQIADKRARSGVIPRMFDNLTASISKIIVQSGVGEDISTYRSVSSSILIKFVTEYSGISVLEKEEIDYDERIENAEDRMERLEDMYWKKFTAMEKALQKMNEQMQNFQSKLAQAGGQ